MSAVLPRTHAPTAAQERLWFLHRFDPADPSHHLSYAYRVEGPLDRDRLAAAFTAVVARHAALRTRFVEPGDGGPDGAAAGRAGRPVAVVAPPFPVSPTVLTAADEDGARALLAELVTRPFDLAGAPPLRVGLVAWGPTEHLLCVVVHHINADGWSMRLVRDEVAALYAGADPAALPAVPDVTDAADAAEDRAPEPDGAADVDWWAAKLRGAPVLDLPTDRPRRAVRATAGDTVAFDLGPALTAAVAATARAHRCTTYMVLLAAYQALLARHAGLDDFCVGTPVARRSTPELERTVGMLTDVLVLRCDTGGDPTFGELLRRTRRTVLEAMGRPPVAFERLLGALDVHRDLSRTPLFQTLFNLHPADRPGPALPGLVTADVDVSWQAARHDLTLDMAVPDPGGTSGLRGWATYSTDLLDRSSAEALVERFRGLLAAAVAAPGTRIGALPVLTDDERAAIAARNATARDRPADTLGDLVLRQARATPDAVAVVAGPVRLRYAELAGRAGALAGWLRDRGIGPGATVALRLARGADLVVAMIGVALAGATSLPIDPDYPAARVRSVLDDAAVALVLDRLPDLPPAGPEDLVSRARPGGAAYLLYTSGSTGRPKGVVVPHAALVNFLLAMRELIGTSPDDVWLGLTSVAFDISVLELYLPLIGGGRVVVADAETARDGGALAALVARAGVTHVQATPSGWRMLLDAGRPAAGAFPVTALCGGEALPLPLARALRSRVRRLVNVYGPTETTVWSTAWTVPEQVDRVLIGAPIANTTTAVVDRAGRECPVGVVGELLIGGAGVAEGYRGRAGLTADRFVPDPAGPPGARRYRTGDLVRRRPGGDLEHVGRADTQVKLRGHRIELGEVEHVVGQAPGVGGVAVVVRDGVLVAYLVGAAGAGLDVDGVRRRAAEQLPGPAVPARFVVLDALPLTPNGKVDRAALPDPGAPAPRAGAVGPRTPAEQRVAEVFEEVLGRSGIGADDDFFALGGHSLTATMVATRLAAALGRPVPVRRVFLSSTVAGLAAWAGEPGPAPGAGDGPVPRADGARVPLTPAQQRLWLLQRLDPGSAAYTVPVALRLVGALDRAALQAAVDAVVARHEALRTRFPEVDGAPQVVVDPPGPVEIAVVPAADEAEARLVVAAASGTPLEIADRPPLRAVLVPWRPDEQFLVLVVHHIDVDGWSMGLVVDELAALYAGRDLPPAPLQIGDVAAWRDGRDDPAGLEHWRAQLADPPVLDLPVDRPRTAGAPRVGATCGFRLDGAATAALTAVGRAHGATPFVVLAAAYQVLLARHTGRTDLVLATVTAGRDRLELEGVVGYLSDTVLLRGDLAGRPTFAALLEATRDRVLDAFAHPGVPVERLIAELGAVADPTRSPLFETMLILHTEETGLDPGAFPGLTATLADPGLRQAKLELAVDVWPSGDGLHVALTYDAALFDDATMTAVAARFARLLTELPGAAHERVDRLPLLTPDDVERLDTWGTGPATPAPLDPARAFAAAAARTPDAVAVASGEERVGYAALDRRADELTVLLRRHGAVQGSVVGICTGRRPDTVVALLAAHRTGAAYLPLDPDLPAERLRVMIADSGAAVVLADPACTDRLPAGCRVIHTTDAAPDPAEPATPGPGAYVIYTAGSTGRPKGVLVGRAGLAARVGWMVAAYGLTADDRVVQLASLAFDTHAEEVFPALAAGARLQLLPDGATSLPELLRGPDGPAVTVLDLPTAYWHALVEQIDEIAWPPALRLVVLGGEAVAPAAVETWHRRFRDTVRLVDTYGPTEATIIATAAELDGSGPPTIGRPIAHTRVALLDAHGGLVPPGAPGELCVGGPGVAHGYLRDPARTAERFVPDPVAPGGGRLYRTGDRARWRPDGRLEFLGRLDDQVKVRGVRIEPGEVEAALERVPGAGLVAVAARDGELVGYTTGPATADELGAALRGTLPPAAVPTRWVRLDRLPRTPVGKLDRAALPDPVAGPAVDRVEPRTAAEELVADVVGDVLGLDGVGAHDDFFALGGHSLHAIRTVARIRSLVGVDVPLRALFAAPSVAALAVTVEDLLALELAGLTDAEATALLDSP